MNHLIKFPVEKGLYALAIVLAIAVRLWGVGEMPLSDPEASLAMQSLNMARGQAAVSPVEPAYVLLTGGLFFFTQASEFTARFWPALLGGLLPLAAYWLRGKIGLRPAVILAFGLALDPGLVAMGRQASGAGMALPLALLAGTLFLHAREAESDAWWAVGILGGLALLGGTALWPGLAGLGVAMLIYRLAGAKFEGTGSLSKTWNWKEAGLGALGALLVVGTMMMRSPLGLGGIGSSLGSYLGGWGEAGGQVPVAQLLVMLPIYHILPLIFGFVGLIRAVFTPEDELGRGLGVWFAAALLLGLLYPLRQTTDLSWVLIPLWMLAARELARIRISLDEQGWAEVGHAVLIVILTIFLVWSFSRLPNPAYGVTDLLQQATLRVLAGFGLLALTFALVVWGWGLRVATHGFRLGVWIVLAFFTLSTTFNSAGLSGTPETEMWRTGALPKEAHLMETTLDDLSMWNHKLPNKLEVAVVGVDSDSLRWLLREYSGVRFLDAIAAEDTPEVVITPWQTKLSQTSAYRRQDFVWWSRPAWSQISPYEFVQWTFFRKVLLEDQSIILWIRSDVFPGQSGNNSNLP